MILYVLLLFSCIRSIEQNGMPLQRISSSTNLSQLSTSRTSDMRWSFPSDNDNDEELQPQVLMGSLHVWKKQDDQALQEGDKADQETYTDLGNHRNHKRQSSSTQLISLDLQTTSARLRTILEEEDESEESSTDPKRQNISAHGKTSHMHPPFLLPNQFIDTDYPTSSIAPLAPLTSPTAAIAKEESGSRAKSHSSTRAVHNFDISDSSSQSGQPDNDRKTSTARRGCFAWLWCCFK